MAAVAIWRHVDIRKLFDRLYLIVAAALFVSTLSIEGFVCLFRNFAFGQSRVEIDIVRVEDHVSLTMIPSRAWKVKAGQYLNIVIPGLGLTSILQGYPMTIAWWTTGPNSCLYFLVEPRSAFAKKLLTVAHRPRVDDEGRPSTDPKDYYFAYFSGPHGRTIVVDKYGSVLLIATGMGIAAQIPYLKELIQRYNSGQARTRKVTLVWQLDDWSTCKNSFSGPPN